MIKRLIYILLILGFAGYGWATNYFVNCELGTGSNNGTSDANAWQSIGAITGISAGDDIYFKAGTECTGSDVPTNGWAISWDGISEANKAIIGAYYGSGTLGLGGNARPIINGTDTKPAAPNTDGLIRAHSGDGYMHFKDLHIKNSLGAGIGIKYSSGTTDYNIIENNYTQQTTYQGIVMVRGMYSIVRDNIVEEASHDRYPGAGIEITGQVGYGGSETVSNYNEIYRNTVYDCWEGIGIYWGSRYTEVYENLSYNNRSYHIYLANARDVNIYNNLAYEGTGDKDSQSDYLIGLDCEDNQENVIKVIGNADIYGNLVSGGLRGIFIINNCFDLATGEHSGWGQSNVYVSNVNVYNNTIVDNEESFYFAHMDSASDINIANNISYLITGGNVHSTN